MSFTFESNFSFGAGEKYKFFSGSLKTLPRHVRAGVQLAERYLEFDDTFDDGYATIWKCSDRDLSKHMNFESDNEATNGGCVPAKDLKSCTLSNKLLSDPTTSANANKAIFGVAATVLHERSHL